MKQAKKPNHDISLIKKSPPNNFISFSPSFNATFVYKHSIVINKLTLNNDIDKQQKKIRTIKKRKRNL